MYSDAVQREVEVKVLEIVPENVMPRLSALGAHCAFRGQMDTTYWDDALRSYKARGQRLRLRRLLGEDGHVGVEHILKERVKQNGVKTSTETPLGVPNVANPYSFLQEQLLAEGLQPIRVERKHRTSYLHGDLRFDFDRILDHDVPPFLEIEGSDDAAVYRGAQMLGIDRSRLLAWSGSDLLRHYGVLPRK